MKEICSESLRLLLSQRDRVLRSRSHQSQNWNLDLLQGVCGDTKRVGGHGESSVYFRAVHQSHVSVVILRGGEGLESSLAMARMLLSMQGS